MRLQPKTVAKLVEFALELRKELPAINAAYAVMERATEREDFDALCDKYPKFELASDFDDIEEEVVCDVEVFVDNLPHIRSRIATLRKAAPVLADIMKREPRKLRPDPRRELLEALRIRGISVAQAQALLKDEAAKNGAGVKKAAKKSKAKKAWVGSRLLRDPAGP